jgi:hypothetical protein
MMDAISLIYGEQVLDDLAFCHRHEKTLERYSKGIMTLRPSPMTVLKAVAADPKSIPGWTWLLEVHPEDRDVLQEFFTRLIRHRRNAGKE